MPGKYTALDPRMLGFTKAPRRFARGEVTKDLLEMLLEGDMNRPEALTRELLLIETDDDGRLHVTTV